MNTFWLKMAVLAVVVVGLIILVNVFYPSESEPKSEPKTVYDVWERDDERLRAEPEAEQPPETERVVEQQPMFKELSLEDEVRAKQLFEWALNQRKMGRLPVMGYKNMVDACREIIEKYPDSEYAFKARRMLRDIPERYRERYNITDEEMGI